MSGTNGIIAGVGDFGISQIKDEAIESKDLAQQYAEEANEALQSLAGADFEGEYNITTNTPALTGTPSSGLNNGKYYIINGSGAIGFAGANFSVGQVFNTGDRLIKKGTQWVGFILAQNASKIITWTAQSYLSGSQVFHNGKIYEANSSTISTDIPGTSTKWNAKISLLEAFQTISNNQFLWGLLFDGDRVPLAIDKDFNIDGAGVSTRLAEGIGNVIVPYIQSALLSALLPLVKDGIGYQTISNNQFLWGLLFDGDRVPLAIDKDFNIDGAGVSTRLAEGIGNVIVPYIQSALLSALLPQVKDGIGYQTISNNQFLWGLLFDGDRVPLAIDKDFNIDGAGFSKRLLDYISANISVTSLSDVINRDNPYVIQQWGDSLTAMTGILETIVSLAGAKYTGVNCGVGGETVPTIVARNGAVPCVTTQSFTIPSDTTEIEISSQANVRLKNAKYNADVKPLIQGTGNSVNPIYIEDIECTMRYDSTTQTWYLKRNTAGTARNISANTVIQFSGASLEEKLIYRYTL
jgi:hypothetical protein